MLVVDVRRHNEQLTNGNMETRFKIIILIENAKKV